MQDVFWLGRSRTGKSLAGEVIASRFGFDGYHVDEAFGGRCVASIPLRHPTLTKWSKSS
ncbi:MAG TPA: hypothetical protein VGQ72_03435 [Pyrinomonadaceae bacterium]|nr:hypothetical protein [Pyrinomonadaceae bacterium]